MTKTAAFFIALWLKLLFRKYEFNFFEILILLCFMMGMGMLMFSVVGTVQSFVDNKLLDIGFILGILYISWGVGQFFDKKKKLNYLKAFFSYMLGMFTFTIVIIIIGATIDYLIK